ncbi:hypothetical protein V1477_006793 [Vespula maculifrons]|uniref:Uncharacterized protein n=1 Tax=Vespula maculifrons TaxID=7453 RepID=A0ABD2CGP9_VESMC
MIAQETIIRRRYLTKEGRKRTTETGTAAAAAAAAATTTAAAGIREKREEKERRIDHVDTDVCPEKKQRQDFRYMYVLATGFSLHCFLSSHEKGI